MFNDCMLQPVTAPSGLFAGVGCRGLVAEPDLDELMHDPMTLALMAADRVDHGALDALLAQIRRNLR